MNHYETRHTLMDYYIRSISRHFRVSDSVERVGNDYIEKVLEFDVWQRRDFYEYLIRESAVIHDGGWVLFCLKPNPYSYYFDHFGVFPLILSDKIQSADAYLTAISADPGGSPADAIAYRGERVVVSSRHGSIIFFFDEVADIAIGFTAIEPRPFDQQEL